ncbi:uncharacterized protein LOC143297186 isoform X2 [Babylonia areolata]|uniref:uncharacterized protein LOC143297186 isoform X2 n=1 Tax=Babylonia areolata TaxID=304850 RepID=UPI003FD04D86
MMNRTVKVTGFSLRGKTVLKLRELFSRVGQVQKVYLSPDKNAAFVRFEYQSAVSYVLDQEWWFGGETLRVRPVVSGVKDWPPLPLAVPESCQSRQAAADFPSAYSYRDYQHTRNTLWIDFPHEHVGAKPCRKRKRKRPDKFMYHHACVSQQTLPTKRKKKHKRKKKTAYLERAASLPFGVAASGSGETKQVFVKGPTTVPLTVPARATAQEVLALVTESSKVPSHLLHVTVEGRALSHAPAIPHGSTLHCTVKGLGGADDGKSTRDMMQQKAQELKEAGNKMYSEKKYEDAVAFYTASINICPLVPAYNNRAMCYLWMSRWTECISDCDYVLQKEPDNMKARLRRGEARKSKGDLNGAKSDLTMVHEKASKSLSEKALSSLQEIEEQLPKEGSEQKLSKSARKKMNKKLRKEQESRQEDTDHTRPEMGTSEASGIKVVIFSYLSFSLLFPHWWEYFSITDFCIGIL